MSNLKSFLPSGLLKLVERCVAGAVIATGAGMALAPNDASATATTDTTTTTPDVRVSPSQAGAILLYTVRTDATTGEQICQHESHASHSSHESHRSHYSG